MATVETSNQNIFAPMLVFFGIIALLLLALMANMPASNIVQPTIVSDPANDDPAVAYAWACAACHGAEGEGVENFGPSIVDSPLLDDSSALMAMFTTAAAPADPEEGFVHPYRGGYPELTNAQLRSLIAYLGAL